MQNPNISPVTGTGINETISQLNSFLRGEISAVETYRQAIEKLTGTDILPQLRDCLISHENRVKLLKDEIVRLGGEPADRSGVWGAFARLMEGGAALFGEKAAIAVLEEGEDHGRNDYDRGLEDLDPPVRRFVETSLLREQFRTHEIMSRLKTEH